MWDLDLGALAVDQQGRVIVAATKDYGYGPRNRLVVLRLLPNGTLDPSFGNDGIESPDIDSISYPESFAAKVMADGDILVAGGYAGHANGRYVGLRLGGSGQLDDSYGEGGVARLAPKVDAKHFFARAASIDSSGRIAFLGYQGELAELRSDGKADRKFGGDGRSRVVFGSGLYRGVGEIAFGADDRVLVTNEVNNPKTSHGTTMAIASYRADGKPDREFAKHGFRRIVVSKFNRPLSLVPQANSKVVLAGITEKTGADNTDGFVFERLDKNGEVDDSYGHHGVSRPGLASLDMKTAMLQNGKILGIDSRYGDDGDDPPGFQIFRLQGNGRPAVR